MPILVEGVQWKASVFLGSLTKLDTAIDDAKSQKSNPDAEEDLEEELEIPKHYLNEHELNFKFVQTSPIFYSLFE